MPSITVHAAIAAAPERVFARLADHEGYARLPAVRSARLLEQGAPDPNGLGAVREIVVSGGLRFVERIIEFEPPHRFAYTMIDSTIPIPEQLGRVFVSWNGKASDVVWTSRFETRPRVIAHLMAPALGRGLTNLLDAIARELVNPG